MTSKTILIRLGVATVLAAVLIGVLSLWPSGGPQRSSPSEVWTCSMHPQIRLPSPGNCPLCGMKLIPVSQSSGEREQLERRAGLEIEAIRHRQLFKEIRTVGKLDYSERQVEFITSRVAGRVDRVFADFTGLDVKKGDHLVEIYSPMLNVAQGELLSALESHEREKRASPDERRSSDSGLETTRTKLRLLGILDEQIAEIERTRKPTTHLTMFAPLGGTVIEKDVRVGQYVAAGAQLYKIANFDPIWLYLNIYESDLAWVRFGQKVEVRLEAFPGETFSGSVTFIDPFLDDSTRTIRVRVNLKNADRRFKPQMYATATIRVALQPNGSLEPTGLEGQYICPMHPEVMQAEPGKCSICEMALERVPERPAVASPSTVKLQHDAGHAGHSEHIAPATTSEQKSAVAKSASDDKADGKHADGSGEKQTDRGELAVPVSAVLDTGRRRITYRLTKAGAYELVELKLGPRAQATDEQDRRRDYYLVLDGLHDGDKVVVQSGFLLDSQRQIEGMPSLLYPGGQAAAAGGHEGHRGSGGPAPVSRSVSPSEGHKH